MGTFRDRMDRDLQIRGYSLNTRKSYLGYVKDFVRYFMLPPDQLTPEHIHQYQLHLTKERKVAWGTFNQAVCALRFFYAVTMEKDWDIRHIPYQKTGRRLPEILSRDEVKRLFDVTANVKHRALLMTMYSGGLRPEEVTNLRATDIDSQRMMIRIEQGKGRKDRYVMLSKEVLAILRDYWKKCKPEGWLFPGQIPGQPLDRSSVQRIFKQAKQKAKITKPCTTYSMRHSFATHLLEDGTNIRVIQRLLGHKSLRTTEVYTHVAETYVSDTPSPIDRLGSGKKPRGRGEK
jgi:site-specific recombinase XerD